MADCEANASGAHLCPEMDAALLFDPDEWRAAYILNKQKPPQMPPTLNQVVRLVARLGGFWRVKVTVSLVSRQSGWVCNASSTLPPGSGIQGVNGSSRLVCNDMPKTQ